MAHDRLGRTLVDKGIVYGRAHGHEKDNEFSLDKFESGAKHFMSLLEKNPSVLPQVAGYAKEYYRTFNQKRRKVENLHTSHAPSGLAAALSTSDGRNVPESKHRIKIAIEPSDSSTLLGIEPQVLVKNEPVIGSPGGPTIGGSSVQWYWLDDENCWEPYPPSLNSLVETSFLAGETSVHLLNHEYTIGIPQLSSGQHGANRPILRF